MLWSYKVIRLLSLGGPEPAQCRAVPDSSIATAHSSIAHVTTMSHHIFMHQSTNSTVMKNITILAIPCTIWFFCTLHQSTKNQSTIHHPIHHPINPRWNNRFHAGNQPSRFRIRFWARHSTPISAGPGVAKRMKNPADEIEWTIWQKLKWSIPAITWSSNIDLPILFWHYIEKLQK